MLPQRRQLDGIAKAATPDRGGMPGRFRAIAETVEVGQFRQRRTLLSVCQFEPGALTGVGPDDDSHGRGTRRRSRSRERPSGRRRQCHFRTGPATEAAVPGHGDVAHSPWLARLPGLGGSYFHRDEPDGVDGMRLVLRGICGASLWVPMFAGEPMAGCCRRLTVGWRQPGPGVDQLQGWGLALWR